MKSSIPKVLINFGSLPMVHRVLSAVRAVDPDPIISVGHDKERVIQAVGTSYRYAHQDRPAGTGYAVLCAKREAQRELSECTIVVPADHPLITSETLQQFVDFHKREGNMLTISTVKVPNFEGDFESFYTSGRVIKRWGGYVERIVELNEADEKEKGIREVNAGYYCFDSEWLWSTVDALCDVHGSGEYYLTDIVKYAAREGVSIGSFVIKNYIEGMGINTPRQFELAKRYAA